MATRRWIACGRTFMRVPPGRRSCLRRRPHRAVRCRWPVSGWICRLPGLRRLA